MEDTTAAEHLYAEAITLDPKFALAHARLSIVNSHLALGPSDNRALRGKARAAADEALRLSPSPGKPIRPSPSVYIGETRITPRP